MDPVTLGLGVVGLGLQLFGTMGQASVFRQAAGVSAGIAADEQQINAQKQQQMVLQSKRMQLENVRNAQRARSQATAAATSQGAQFGSGIEGGKAQITNQAGFNALGVNQNLQIGQNIFGINNDISAKKMQLAQLGGQAATDQGFASLGGSLMKSGPTVGGISRDLFSTLGSFGGGVSGGK